MILSLAARYPHALKPASRGAQADLKSPSVLKLRTLGAVLVVDSAGLPALGVATQRRLLALLAALAVADDAGLSRDRAAALLWPESDAERAGQSLTQGLYATRRALGVDDLFLTAGDLRLNPDRITSDVGEFRAALAASDWPAAVAAYGGAFLDGFFVPGAATFERWATSVRRELEDQFANALARLARAAEAGADTGSAVMWWKRLAAVRPLDASVAASLMNAMARSGDRAGAVRHAEIHAALLRNELDLGPDPLVVAAARRLRALVAHDPETSPRRESEAVATATTTAGTPTAPLGPEKLAGSAPRAEESVAAGVATIVQPRSRSDRLVPRLVLLTAVAIAAVGIAVAVRNRRAPVSPAAGGASAAGSAIVAPFRVSGASPSLAYLRDGLVELFSARLTDDDVGRWLGVGTALASWRRAGVTSHSELPRDSLLALARSVGVDRVLLGSVVGSPTHVVLTANLVRVADGRELGATTAEGSADSISTLVDRVVGDLLVAQAGETATLTGQTTRSLPALRAFLRGQAAFRDGRYDEALRAYRDALGADSSFGLAALQMVRAGDRLQVLAVRGAPLNIAWLHRRGLNPHDQALLDALAGPAYPRPATVVDQLAAWQRLVVVMPDRADAWYELGARLFHSGPVLGLADARLRSAVALRRALSIDSTYTAARRLLLLLAASGAPGGFPAPVATDSTEALSSSTAWRVAVARGDTRALAALRREMPRLGPVNLRVIAQASEFDAVDLDDARRALAILRARPARPSERLEQAEAAHSLAMVEGRIADARTAVRRFSDLQPGTHAALRLEVLDALYGDADRDSAGVAAHQLEQSSDAATGGIARTVRVADACVLGQWQASNGDTTGARLSLSLVATAADGRVGARTASAALIAETPPAVCALLLGAALDVARGADARRALAHLDSLALVPPVAGDASAYAPILVARLHASIGDVPGALAAIRRRVYLMGWPRYLATALREEASYARLLAERDLARSALERFVVLRAHPDPSLAQETETARQALATLGTKAAH